MARRKSPRISDALLDELLAGADAKMALEPNGLLDDLKRALAERALNAEMDHHLGDGADGNVRNGYGRKTVLTGGGTMTLEVPRDRQGTFDPQLIAKYQRRFPGFDDKIISMYARGMSTRNIQEHVRELYGIDVSPDLVSTVTDSVLDETAAWQARPLDPIYPLVFFDAIRVKIRDEGVVRNKAIHVALGVRADGTKEVLGLWLELNEGAKFWLRVMNELKNRGVEDILLAVVDGLKGFPEAIQAAFPDTLVQTCIVHLLRHSLEFVSWKDRKAVVTALKNIYRAVDAAAGEKALQDFENGPWGRKYPAIGQLAGLHLGQESLRLLFHRLRQQAPRPLAQNLGQRVVNLIRLTKAKHGAIFLHGVSLLSGGSDRLVTRLDTPPSSDRHHPFSPIAPCV